MGFNMNKFIFYILIVFSFYGYAQIADSQWQTDFLKVKSLSKKNKKPILVYFSGSDWCAPCKKLKTDLFENESYETLLSSYNLLYVDIPQNRDLIGESQYDKNKKLMTKYNSDKKFPTLVVLNKRGKEIKRMSGYFNEDQLMYYVNFLK